MNEAQLKTKVLAWLKKRFPGSFWWKTSEMFYSGIPDIIGCVKGRIIAIELKISKGKLTKLQEYTLNELSKAGAIAGVCHSLEEVKKLLIIVRYT